MPRLRPRRRPWRFGIYAPTTENVDPSSRERSRVRTILLLSITSCSSHIRFRMDAPRIDGTGPCFFTLQCS